MPARPSIDKSGVDSSSGPHSNEAMLSSGTGGASVVPPLTNIPNCPPTNTARLDPIGWHEATLARYQLQLAEEMSCRASAERQALRSHLEHSQAKAQLAELSLEIANLRSANAALTQALKRVGMSVDVLELAGLEYESPGDQVGDEAGGAKGGDSPKLEDAKTSDEGRVHAEHDKADAEKKRNSNQPQELPAVREQWGTTIETLRRQYSGPWVHLNPRSRSPPPLAANAEDAAASLPLNRRDEEWTTMPRGERAVAVRGATKGGTGTSWLEDPNNVPVRKRAEVREMLRREAENGGWGESMGALRRQDAGSWVGFNPRSRSPPPLAVNAEDAAASLLLDRRDEEWTAMPRGERAVDVGGATKGGTGVWGTSWLEDPNNVPVRKRAEVREMLRREAEDGGWGESMGALRRQDAGSWVDFNPRSRSPPPLAGNADDALTSLQLDRQDEEWTAMPRGERAVAAGGATKGSTSIPGTSWLEDPNNVPVRKRAEVREMLRREAEGEDEPESDDADGGPLKIHDLSGPVCEPWFDKWVKAVESNCPREHGELTTDHMRVLLASSHMTGENVRQWWFDYRFKTWGIRGSLENLDVLPFTWTRMVRDLRLAWISTDPSLYLRYQ